MGFKISFPLLGSVLVILVLFSLFVNQSVKTAGKVGYGFTNPSLGEIYEPGAKLGFFEGKSVSVPQIVFNYQEINVLGESSEEKWIEVDLSEQKVRAWQGNQLYLESLVSTGLPWFPTPTGEFKIWYKVRSTKMEGGTGSLYYNLPNVPYVMFFEGSGVPGFKGYSLHGTYWHNDFGRVHSHGCVNLPTPIAEKLYYWTTPTMPEGKRWIRANETNLGTRIIIHS